MFLLLQVNVCGGSCGWQVVDGRLMDVWAGARLALSRTLSSKLGSPWSGWMSPAGKSPGTLTLFPYMTSQGEA